jgi:ribosomal protein S18 acetylase RimI-like enzyme
MTSVVIRKAVRSEMAAVEKLLDTVWMAHYEKEPDIFTAPKTLVRQPGVLSAWFKKIFNINVINPNELILVAELDKRLVGALRADVRVLPRAYLPYFVQHTFVHVTNIVVEPDLRRHGIGTQLLDEAHKFASERKADYIELVVWELNSEAKGFYEAAGYDTISTTMRKPLK